MVKVTVWNEYRHERNDSKIAAVYPEGIHNQIAGFLKKRAWTLQRQPWMNRSTGLRRKC